MSSKNKRNPIKRIGAKDIKCTLEPQFETKKFLNKKVAFNNILIANRGEIAVRACKTFKKMGIKSLSIYTEADNNAIHTKVADNSVCIGEKNSYLNIEKIIKVAKDNKCDAIFPGYGFLSENSDFAKACETSGITFIGPTSDQIESFGLKHIAKSYALKANVPLIKGSELLDNVDEAIQAAHSLYPVMLKSTAGGGGLGLEICRNQDELVKCFDKVKRLGEAQFGNGGVFLEQYIEQGRHIEVQIFGDGKGNVVTLGERCCSIQRRNQKIIEETPAPALPEKTKNAMLKCAQDLGKSINYLSAGTVEFIYEFKKDKFYFLEVNTRIQVEHTVTEEVLNIDIVEMMTKLACGNLNFKYLQNLESRGHAIEVRVNCENPMKNFKPSPGILKEVYFPKNVRIDTCIQTGSEVSVFYDSMVAKVIVWSETRKDAINRMLKVLDEIVLDGINTNVEYLKQIINDSKFNSGTEISTRFLETFRFTTNCFEIIEGGAFTTIHDYPGRIKYWAVGIPPSGPFDSYSLRLANRIVGNNLNAAGLECTMTGPTVLFHTDSIVAIVGAEVDVTLDGKKMSMGTAIFIKKGQTLSLSKITNGIRTYVAFRGGINNPMYLGSRSTFNHGKFGFNDGAKLTSGDILPLFSTDEIETQSLIKNEADLRFCMSSEMLGGFKNSAGFHQIGVMIGPHEDYFQKSTVETFFTSDYQVHHNCSRLGIRLIGPKPEFTRADGGTAGLHPSNIHDCEYAIGSINFTGDSPVILGPDGPSLGGFVCLATVANAELWKLGQVKPGDKIRFVNLKYEEARELEEALELSIKTVTPLGLHANTFKNNSISLDCMLASIPSGKLNPSVFYRQAGDCNILLEYGEMELDLSLRVRIYALMVAIGKTQIEGIIELSPGVRSLQIQFNSNVLHQKQLVEYLIGIEDGLGDVSSLDIPSRIVHLPFAFEDSSSLEAVKRYSETIKSSAPYLPNNVDFIQRINGLASREEVLDTVFKATYLTLGLGDVYLGAPCAVPLDPRHRLMTSKYNPARTHTAEGTVGLGGMYLCIYGMDSPGGYQLVGRTSPIYTRQSGVAEPWLLRPFDQIKFYPVTESELTELRKVKDQIGMLKTENAIFNLKTYQDFLEENAVSIKTFTDKQKYAFEKEVLLWEKENDVLTNESNVFLQCNENDDGNIFEIKSNQYACVWKILVSLGDYISVGQEVVIVEAMKMETKILSSVEGKVISISCSNGKVVKTGDILISVEVNSRVEEDIEEKHGLEEEKASDDSKAYIFKLKTPVVRGDASTGSLNGLRFAVKDNIDVFGAPTTAACPTFSYFPDRNSTVVEKILSSGAELTGKTNLDQFACGLNGTRSPFGVVPNSIHPDFVSGGSSSGSAFLVANGAVDFSLGTDTAGSGRVPAGLNNIVGFKPTKGLISTRGVVPAAQSVDCVSIFAPTVDLAWKVLLASKGYDDEDPYSRNISLNYIPFPSKFTYGVPNVLEFCGDKFAEKEFYDTLSSIDMLGGKCVKIDYSILQSVANMLYDSALVSERYAAIHSFFDSNEEDVIEPVRSIIKKGKSFSAAELFEAQVKIQKLSQEASKMWKDIDFLVVPTAPTHYKIEDMRKDPVNLNKNLGYYTNFVNLLDYAALAVPSSIRGDGLPFGVTFIGQCGSDYQLAEFGQKFHHSRNLKAGATNNAIPSSFIPIVKEEANANYLPIAVVGAHLKNMPLHYQLVERGCRFIKLCKTSPEYKLFSLSNSIIKKPALVHVGKESGASIEIEIYGMPLSEVGSFLHLIPSPLALGTLTIDDGSSVKGFVAEPRAQDGATDVTSFGSWRKYIASL